MSETRHTPGPCHHHRGTTQAGCQRCGYNASAHPRGCRYDERLDEQPDCPGGPCDEGWGEPPQSAYTMSGPALRKARGE